MTTFDSLVDATILMSLGLALLALGRRLPAAAKHLICATTLFSIVLLPLVSRFPLPRSQALFTLTLHVPSTPVESHPAILAWIASGWACGGVVVALRFLAGLVYLAWQTRRASTLVPGLTPGQIDARFAEVATPLVWGLFRPTILLPVSFRDWSPEQKKAAIDHEMAHVVRLDSWTALIVVTAQAMYWFHPLIWLISAKLQEQREFAADDRVLAAGTDAAEYARFLVSTARAMPSRKVFGCAMLARTGALRSRVEHLFISSHRAPALRSRALTTCCIGVLLGSACVLPAGARFSEQVYKTGGDVSAPTLVHKVEPKYTRKSRRDKTQGIVVLNLVVSRHGTPESVHVESGLTPDLDQQAVRAVSSWRFKPATKDGHAVPVQAKVEVHFRLL
jgi:TonB family protein